VEGFDQEVSRRELETVLRGSIPMAIATASSEAKSNVTYVSRVHIVDDERIALSNQFLGKTKRNLAENPRASLLAICPSTYSQYRIDVTFEQSLRSGSVFDELRKDIQALAALGQATKHFELLSADIFRVNRVAKVFETDADRQRRELNSESPPISVTLLRELSEVAGRTDSSEQMMRAIARQLEQLRPDSTVAAFSPGSPPELIDGSSPLIEIEALSRIVGHVSSRAEPVRLDNFVLSLRYAESATVVEQEHNGTTPAAYTPPKSLLAVPVMSRSEVVGVLTWSSTRGGQFDRADMEGLTVVAGVLSPLLASDNPNSDRRPYPPGPHSEVALFTVTSDDGSVFIDHEYVIRGLSGEILAYLLGVHAETGRIHFSNRELRSAPELDIPGLRDNLESRLLELQRRLVDKSSPVTIERTSRGRFDLVVETPFSLDRPHTQN